MASDLKCCLWDEFLLPLALLRSTARTARAGPPKVLHYGNDLSVNGTGYTFSKIALRQAGFDATICPPWHPDQSRLWGGLLPYPPSPLSLTGQVWQ